jgi:hypothetical protein
MLDRLREAKRNVLAARLLTKHGLPTSAAEVAAADAEVASRLLQQLFRRMASSVGITDSRWRSTTQRCLISRHVQQMLEYKVNHNIDTCCPTSDPSLLQPNCGCRLDPCMSSGAACCAGGWRRGGICESCRAPAPSRC